MGYQPVARSTRTVTGASARDATTSSGDWPGWQKDLAGSRYAGDTIYFGGSDGKFYARDARSGAEGRAIVWDGPTVSGGKVFFGDARGYFYALDQRTGALEWSTRIDAHPAAIVTSSPIVHKGPVYVGVSSGENTAGKEYPCCTFRGHLDALDTDTGQTGVAVLHGAGTKTGRHLAQ